MHEVNPGMIMGSRGGIAVWLLVAVGCGSDAPRSLPPTVVSDSAGIEIVRNQFGATEKGRTLIEEELRIGAVDGTQEELLHRVTGIAVDGADTIYVALGQASEIRVFAPGGEYVRTLGGRGEGPGEFLQVGGLLLTGDTVVVEDGRLQRTTLMGPDGEVLDTWPRGSSVEGSLSLVGRSANGWLATLFEQQWPEAGRAVEQTLTVQLLSEVREVMEAISRGEVHDAGGRDLVEFSWGRRFGLGGLSYDVPAWEARENWGTDGSGRIYVTSRSEYRIDVHDRDGELVRRIYRDHQPVVLDEGTRNRYLDEVEAHFDTLQAAGPADAGRPYVDRVEPYRRRVEWSDSIVPALGTLLVSEAGHLLVERPDLVEDPVALVWSRVGPGPSRWDVYDVEGVFSGTIEFPLRFTPHVLGSGWVIGVLRDELGVEYVVRYQIDAGVGTQG